MDHLRDAKAGIQAFAESRDPARLEDAIRSLEQVELFEPAAGDRLTGRQELARTWLQVMAAMEVARHPAFDPHDRPTINVAPPRGPRITRMSGVAPKDIPEPEVRAAYVQAITRNRAKAARYHQQSRLRFLENRATESLEKFVRYYFTEAAPDRQALAALLEEADSAQPLRDRLLALQSPPEPQLQ